MTHNTRVPADGSELKTTADEDEIHVARAFNHRFGMKAALNIPAPWEDGGAAKDAVKALDWDATHRTWDSEAEAWTVDLDQLNHVVEHMTDAGYNVTVDSDVIETFEDGGPTSPGREFLPDRRDGDDVNKPDADDSGRTVEMTDLPEEDDLAPGVEIIRRGKPHGFCTACDGMVAFENVTTQSMVDGNSVQHDYQKCPHCGGMAIRVHAPGAGQATFRGVRIPREAEDRRLAELQGQGVHPWVRER